MKKFNLIYYSLDIPKSIILTFYRGGSLILIFSALKFFEELFFEGYSADTVSITFKFLINIAAPLLCFFFLMIFFSRFISRMDFAEKNKAKYMTPQELHKLWKDRNR